MPPNSISEAGVVADDDSDDVGQLTEGAPAGQGKARARRRLVTVEPTAILYSCYLAISQPLMSQYVYSQIAKSRNYTGHAPGDDNGNCTVLNTSSPEYIAQNEVQQEAARWMVILTASMVPAVFSTLVLTGYCDRAGRRLPMLLPLVGVTIRSIICVLIVVFELHIGFLFIALLVEALSGGPPCILMAIFSYVADVTTKEQRTFRILVVELCLVASASLGDIGGGYVIGKLGFVYPFAIILGINFTNLIYTYFLVPETIERVPGTKAISLSYCKDIVIVYCRRDETFPGRRFKLCLCLVIWFITNTVTLGKGDCEVYHLLAAPFCWKSFLIGIFQATCLMVGTVGSLVGTGLLQRKIGDVGLLLGACLSGVAYEVMFAMSDTLSLVFLTSLAGMWYHMVVAMLRSTCSKEVQQNEQGALFAGISVVQLSSVLVGLMTYDAIYQATVDLFPPTVFLVMAGCLLVSTLLTLLLLIQEKVHMKHRPNFSLLSAEEEA